jgi:ubiquitin-conjugating enzyme (huntingtin interacting protein 2)
VAKQYKSNRKAYEDKAKLWTKTYAKDPEEINKEKVQKLMEMGFPEDKVRDALTKAGWNEETAIASLIGSG